MPQPQLLSLICGLLGGAARVAVGITKYFQQNEGKQIKFGYLSFSLVTAVLTGGAAGLLADPDWRLSTLFGYVGTDLLENAYKIVIRKQTFDALTNKININKLVG